MATILVIDDSEAILSFVSDALSAAGHTVLTARSGLDANKYVFGADRPDLILLDIIMPLLDGEKVLMAFKKSPIASAVPVVFFSTRAAHELQQLVDKHGASGYICKPIEADALRTSVQGFLA